MNPNDKYQIYPFKSPLYPFKSPLYPFKSPLYPLPFTLIEVPIFPRGVTGFLFEEFAEVLRVFEAK
jgi:hypothetical protein